MKDPNPFLRRLSARRFLARFAILFERLWPALWPPLGVAGRKGAQQVDVDAKK